MSIELGAKEIGCVLSVGLCLMAIEILVLSATQKQNRVITPFCIMSSLFLDDFKHPMWLSMQIDKDSWVSGAIFSGGENILGKATFEIDGIGTN